MGEVIYLDDYREPVAFEITPDRTVIDPDILYGVATGQIVISDIENFETYGLILAATLCGILSDD